MDAMERGGGEELILKAALECLGDESEMSNLQPAEFDRMATTIVGAIPERWEEIRTLYPRLKKRAQNAIVQALFKCKPPVRDQEVYRTLALHSQQLDPHYRAALLGRLARLGDTAEAGRLVIHLLQDYNDGAMRPGPLSRISVNDCVTLYNLLIDRSAELMLFPKAVLRISLDWNVRLQAEPAEKRRLIGLLARLLAKMKWRDIGDELLGPYFNAFVNMSEAGTITLTPEWPMLFKLILKQLRHRATDQDVLMALGKLIRQAPAEQPEAAPMARKKPVEAPKVVYDPHSGVGWANQTIYPPHVAKQSIISRIPGLAPESFVADRNDDEEPADNSEDHVTAETEETEAVETQTEAAVIKADADEADVDQAAEDKAEAVNAAAEPPALSDAEEDADESEDEDEEESQDEEDSDEEEDEEEDEAEEREADEDDEDDEDDDDADDEVDEDEGDADEDVKAARPANQAPVRPAPITPAPVSRPAPFPASRKPSAMRPAPMEPYKAVAPAVARLKPAQPENGKAVETNKKAEPEMDLAQIVLRLDQLETLYESGLNAVRDLQAQVRRIKG